MRMILLYAYHEQAYCFPTGLTFAYLTFAYFMRTFDYSKLQSQQQDSEILGLAAQIHEYKGRQELYLKQKPAALVKLIDIAKVYITKASNKIEGIVTPNTRIQQLCMEKTTPRNRGEEEIMATGMC